MVKQTLVEIVQKKLAATGLNATKVQATAVVDGIFSQIKQDVDESGEFSYPKFGKFHVAYVFSDVKITRKMNLIKI